ncbi:MAG: hypothetical protein GW905_11970 [Rhodobacterales bacterium]|nr:hypothetical protein [Rhodobacterales bacterium]
MSNIIKLPTAPQTYYTVNKIGPWFDVVLVTPCPGKNIKTRLVGFRFRHLAIERGKQMAAEAKRPFKVRGASV